MYIYVIVLHMTSKEQTYSQNLLTNWGSVYHILSLMHTHMYTHIVLGSKLLVHVAIPGTPLR